MAVLFNRGATRGLNPTTGRDGQSEASTGVESSPFAGYVSNSALGKQFRSRLTILARQAETDELFRCSTISLWHNIDKCFIQI